MNYSIYFLLCAALAVPVIFGYPPGSCDGYTNITDSWRNIGYEGNILTGYPNDDEKLVGSWWRFTGIGGDKVSEICVGPLRGGTKYTLHILPARYPPGELETPYKGEAMGYFNKFCNDFIQDVDIVLCPGGYYIYRPMEHEESEMAYVTMHSTCGPDSCGPSAICNMYGGCVCVPGTTISSVSPPTPESFQCEDIDECLMDPCGGFANCTNIHESYTCLCIEGYEPTNPGPPAENFNECIDIDECNSAYPCGQSNNTVCTNSPASFQCDCIEGYKYEPDSLDVCQDVNECETPDLCGPASKCINTVGSYLCECDAGYSPENSVLEVSPTNNCTDIDECNSAYPCGQSIYTVCTNSPGSFHCNCSEGYKYEPGSLDVCQDVNECETPDYCVPASICINTVGSYLCECDAGYSPENSVLEVSPTNTCIDIDECETPLASCGPQAMCENFNGSYDCTCEKGFTPTDTALPTNATNICIDINECLEIPPICGKGNLCLNDEGTFHCFCAEGFYPSTGILWEEGITVCKSVQDILAETSPVKGRTKARTFLVTMLDQLMEHKIYLAPGKVENCLAAATEAAGVGPHVESDTLGSHGDGVTGSVIIAIAELLVAGSNPSGVETFNITLNSSTLEMSLIGVNASMNGRPLSLSTTAQKMDIHLEKLDFNGYAPAAFLNLNGLDRLLSHEFFETENKTEMFGDVFTVFLPMNTTNLTLPINFTIYHEKKPPTSGLATCVFWEDRRTNITDNEKPGDPIRWSEEGCWVSYSDENLTVCSCSHLSTFALIMQIGEPPPESAFLDWLNRVCVAVGLFFFALAILTFLLCSWNPKINNTARLHLCITLGLFHLLLLWNDKFLKDEVACTVMAGVLHFLVVASFVWMLLEAVQLYLLVRRLSKVQVIQKDGLPRPLLYLIGYGVPLVIIGVSGAVYSDGYGPIEAGACWLSRKRNFNWALTGPVIAVLILNFILFIATLWSLRTTLANMKSGASKSQDAMVVIFKIVAQFVILGCTWLLGLYQTNIFFQVLFIVLNSQQGTFLYIVHCLLNKEVREEYIRWLSGSAFEKRRVSEKDVPSISEEIDKGAEEVSQ